MKFEIGQKEIASIQQGRAKRGAEIKAAQEKAELEARMSECERRAGTQ